ncbi:hypothetical protein B0O99DRAFT_687657 [Bisporella sp. PMI_857]|nr:hypothetical protein B0O99DRAFT_687657 [Bisporella sp. PMI_857]
MSPTTRAGIRHRNSISVSNPTANSIDDKVENAVQRAYDLVPSTDTASIVEAWQDLRQSHLALRNRRKIESFPHWVLSRVPHQIIPQMLEAVYGKGARRLEFSAPIVYQHFGVPQWHFVLFFGGLSEHSARRLTTITKRRPSLSFDSLYREVKQNRSKRLKARPMSTSDDALEFKPADFQSCLTTERGYEIDSENEQDISSVPSHESDWESSNESDHSCGSGNDEDNQGNIRYGNYDGDYQNDLESNFEEIHYESDFLDGSADNNLSTGPRSPVEIVLDTDVVSLISTSSSTLASTIHVDTSDGSRSAGDMGVINTRRVVQDQEAQDLEPEVPQVGRVQDSELMAEASNMVTAPTRGDIQRCDICRNETEPLHLITLGNSIKSLSTKYGELCQQQDAILNRLAEAKEHWHAKLQLLSDFDDSRHTEYGDTQEAILLEMVNLNKKRKIEKINLQEHKEQKLKLDTFVNEVNSHMENTAIGLGINF